MLFNIAAISVLSTLCLGAPHPNPKTHWGHVAAGTAVGFGAATLVNQRNQINGLQDQQNQQLGASSQPPAETFQTAQPIQQCQAPVVMVNGVAMHTKLVNGQFCSGLNRMKVRHLRY